MRISAPNECPFYSAAADRERDRRRRARIGCAAKLEAVGLRSVNNVVDVTNFVMLELGQPLHAFDADKLSGGIDVRLAQPNEKFLALDGRTYQLDSEKPAHRGCGTSRWDRRRDGRRRYRRDGDDAERASRERLLFCRRAFGARREN